MAPIATTQVAQVPTVQAAPVQTALTPCEQVRQEATKYSGWNVQLITAIAGAESGCDPSKTGDTTLTYWNNNRIYGYSVGVLQVRILPGREACDSHDLATNVRCAYGIWQGQGYRAWSVYNSGKYRAYM